MLQPTKVIVANVTTKSWRHFYNEQSPLVLAFETSTQAVVEQAMALLDYNVRNYSLSFGNLTPIRLHSAAELQVLNHIERLKMMIGEGSVRVASLLQEEARLITDAVELLVAGTT